MTDPTTFALNKITEIFDNTPSAQWLKRVAPICARINKEIEAERAQEKAALLRVIEQVAAEYIGRDPQNAADILFTLAAVLSAKSKIKGDAFEFAAIAVDDCAAACQK